MWLRHEIDHSPPSNAEVKNLTAIPAPLHTSLWHELYLNTDLCAEFAPIKCLKLVTEISNTQTRLAML
jgi:hypothetical protein